MSPTAEPCPVCHGDPPLGTTCPGCGVFALLVDDSDDAAHDPLTCLMRKRYARWADALILLGDEVAEPAAEPERGRNDQAMKARNR